MISEPNHSGTILLVAAEPVDLGLALAVLQQAGYRVEVATDGDDAFQRATRIAPDLIIVDVIMPGLRGYETCRRFRAREQTRDIPLLLVCERSESLDEVNAIAFGAADYVVKPIDPEGLLARVRPQVAIGRLERQLRELNSDLDNRIAARSAELAAANESLREQARLLDLTHDAILVVDMDGLIKYWNRGAEEQYGWTAELAVGSSVIDLLRTSFPARRDQIIAELMRTNRWEGELVHTRKDGSQVIVASRWSLQRDQQGTPAAIIETNDDITERKCAEQALRQSEAYLAEGQRLTHTGSWSFDIAANRYAHISEECFRIFGFEQQDPLPTRDLVFRRIHPDDSERVNRGFQKSVQGKVVTSDEFRIVLPDGAVRNVYAIRHPILNTAGHVVELFGTALDVTERKRAEEERERLRQFKEQLGHLNRVSLMGELVASVAHEINQPLSGIVSNGGACLRWLAGDAPNLQEAREAARRIIRDGKRAGDVIAHIRGLTTKATPPAAALDLNETIREVLVLVADQAKRSSVTIQTQFAGDLSRVSGDRVQLQQVVLNLAINAIEAMSGVGDRARELIITTRNLEPDQVQVTFQDSGVGIHSQQIGKIFDSFYTTKPGGMGMGLSICRSIIEAHGGRLWATVKHGPGATLNFALPKRHAGETHAGDARV